MLDEPEGLAVASELVLSQVESENTPPVLGSVSSGGLDIQTELLSENLGHCFLDLVQGLARFGCQLSAALGVRRHLVDVRHQATATALSGLLSDLQDSEVWDSSAQVLPQSVLDLKLSPDDVAQ